jgi:primosomal protein N' (replication factor Y)
VAVARPVRGAYTYSVPPEMLPLLQPGMRVAVPFGRGTAMGFYLGPTTQKPKVAPKPIAQLVEPVPALTPELLKLMMWTADYYRFPLGEALKSCLPPGLSDLSGAPTARPDILTWIEPLPAAEDAATPRGPVMKAVLSYLEAQGKSELEELLGAVPNSRDAIKRLEAQGRVRIITAVREKERPESNLSGSIPTKLSDEQAKALAILEPALDAGGFQPFLLHGVTGSGKTEVYLRSIARVLAMGKRALCLVPEIGLTPQLMGRFRARFGDQVALLHSGLKDSERLAEWRRIRDGQAPVAVGVRSAIFAPIDKLGLIVVDEEHDPSFKQEEKLRYHARDLALVRGQQSGCAVVLGSATPSLETLANARSGRYGLIELNQRINERPLPRVEVVDLRQRPLAEGESPASMPRQLAPALSQALREVLDKGEQAILFLNRRGHSTFVTCAVCGLTVKCPNCSISLTHHVHRNRLLCHYCGFEQHLPESCPECKSQLLKLGFGTEKVEEEVIRDFPSARVLRLDRDSATDATELTRALSDFARNEFNVMIGTQMVAKGHDFPGVTLVGVILADTALALPDFRAAERTFQVLAQVAGRAGRGKQAGRVLVQTYNPEADAISHVVGHDFNGFAAGELERREALNFPPYAKLLAIRVDAMLEDVARETIASLARVAELAIRRQAEPLRLLGPAPAPLARVRGRYRFQMLMKGRSHKAMAPIVARIEAMLPTLPSSARVLFDVDPVSMM